MNTMTMDSEIKAVAQAAVPAEFEHPDYGAIKTRQQATWGSGDYGRIGVTLQITGEQLCEAMDLRAGGSVLDVAGGNGNATLAAARRFYDSEAYQAIVPLRQAASEGQLLLVEGVPA